MAKYLAPSELGLFGLVAAVVSYSLYVVGLDFYTYSTRELIASSHDKRAGMLKGQLLFFCLMYVLVLPLLAIVFLSEWLPWSLAGWVFLLIVTEHLAQELNRLYVAMSRQLLASSLLFIRSGLWVGIILPLMIIDADLRELSVVLTGWFGGALVAVFIGGFLVLWEDFGPWRGAVDWQWIVKGLRVSLPLLVATLALRGLHTLDKYWFESLAGVELLGPYVLYFGICSAYISFLDAGVFSFIYPKLIKLNGEKDFSGFYSKIRSMTYQVVVVSFAFWASVYFLVDSVLEWIGRPIYVEFKALLYAIGLSFVIFGVSMIFHFGLYARHRDSSIIISHVVGVFVFVITALLTGAFFPVYAIPVSFCFSFLAILIIKMYAFFQDYQVALRD